MIITLVLAALAALAPFAIDTYLPAFHVIAETLGATDVEVQQSLTFYLLPYAAMTLWHGAISDAIGRIATIKWGLAIFVVASIGCALATSVEMLWFFRALQGASGGAGNTVARAMVRDLFQGAQAQRVMASVQMLFGIAPAVAPIIGGILLGINWQIIFIFLAVYSAVSLWAAMRYLPETMPAEKRMKLSVKNVFSSYKTIFSDREYTKLIIAIGANFSGFFLYVLASPVFLGKHLALGPQEYGYLFIPTVTGMILGSWLARRAAGKVASYKVVKLSYAWMSLMALINLVVCFTQPVSLVANILPVALFNIGMAMCMPILSIAALDRHAKIRGTAASGQAFMQMLLSTVSAGIVVPYVWYAPSGLASAMFAYLGVSIVVIMQTQLWKSSQIRPLA
ncbi:MAG: multidrug effflux MFS transporter [Methylophilaceae bacterium]|nr:multidrug effflux MFS transporter [Methylophilaceae bacterium]